MDHWFGVVTCTSINTASSLSSTVTCCFCRPGLCFRATAFSSLFHTSDLQMNFKQSVHGEELLSSCSQGCALCQTCLPSTQETSSCVSYWGVFYTLFSILRKGYKGQDRGFRSTLATRGPFYTFGSFTEMPGVGREKKTWFSILIVNVNEKCEPWQVQLYSEWIYLTWIESVNPGKHGLTYPLAPTKQ